MTATALGGRELTLRVYRPEGGVVLQPELSAVTRTTDVLPGVYEGGFKLWECARDMMVVLEELRLQGTLEVRRSQP